VKRCASCGREIPDSATVCDTCDAWAAEHVRPAQAAPPPTAPPTTAVTAPSQPSAERNEAPVSSAPTAKPGKGRHLVFALAGLATIAILMFTLLPARAVPAARVAAAQAGVVKPRPAVAAALKPAVATQAWSSELRAYWTGNQRHSAAFELAAENTVPIWMSQVRPLLIVRCLSKRTEAFVFTGSALKIEPDTEDHTVNFRFDDEPGTTVRWSDSAEHDALFAPDAVGFAQRVMRARTLRFGYTPHNAAPVEARFEVSGLAELLEPVTKECGWKK
jgi:hypothetical protein